MWLGIISLFPEMFKAITDFGVISKAIKNGLINIYYWNPRDFSENKHKSIDSRPYGGGPGMVLMAKPLLSAINKAKKTAGKGAKIIYLSPKGKKLDHSSIINIVYNHHKIIIICGRYEGIDERIIFSQIDEEWSIGDYVISGGELAAMVFIDAVARFLPGVLGYQSSAREDSFANGLLDYP